MIHNAATDSTTLESSRKFYQRPPNGLMKINDVKRRRKQKKLQWMRKLYEQKMLKFNAGDDEVKLLSILKKSFEEFSVFYFVFFRDPK